MAIPIQCPECHKKYQAPDHMAGKRVKCKHCGVPFLIAADARSADAEQDMSALDELNALAEPGRREAPKRAAAGAAAGGEDIDSLFQCEYPSDGAPRTNKLYVFPMSRLLDQWLPPVLLAVGLIWAVREAFERNDSGRPWVGFFRAAVFVLAFFASVFPFTQMGVRAASCKLNFELPPQPGLRIMGVYAVPFALACAMWLVLGGASGLLIGALIGAVVALPLLFLLFRLLPVEAPVAFGYATGSFFLSLVVSVAAVIALNLMLVGTLRAMKSEQTLAASPFGPGFKWDTPAETVKKTVVQNTGQGTIDPVEGGGDAPPEGEDAATQPTTDALATTAPIGTEPGGAGEPDMTSPTSPTANDVVRPAPPDTGVATAKDPGRTVNPNPNERPANPDAGRVEAPAGAFVREVRIAVPGAFKQIVQPLVPGPRLAVVRELRPGFDRVELWDAAAWKKTAEMDVPRSPEGNRYSLSPDGEYLCYPTDFPRLAVQVWSFTAGRLHRQVDLEAADGDPQVVGFVTAEQFLMRRDRRDGQIALQVWNAKAPGRPRQFPLSAFDMDPRRFAVSPDGSAIAFIVLSGGRADLESWSLATGRPIKQMPVVEVDWRNNVTVAGLAFSPDGQRIAAVFSGGQGAGFFVAWPAAGRGGRAVLQQFLPVGVNPPRVMHAMAGAFGFDGRGFHWLDGGAAWLLFGGSVFDTETGALLGSPNQPNVRAQYADPRGNACQLIHADEFGGVHLFTHVIDLATARRNLRQPAAPGPAAGGF